MPANLKDYTSKLDELSAQIAQLQGSVDTLTLAVRTIASHQGGIDNRGHPPKPMRAEYGGKTTRKGQS